MTNRELCQTFVEQKKIQARASNGTLYFAGDTLYSYGSHFPLARLTTDNDSKEGTIALVTTRKYSVTTFKHKSFAVSAILRAGYTIVEVEDVTKPHRSPVFP